MELINSCSGTSSAPTGSESSGGTRRAAFAELLIDCEEDRTLRRAVTVGGGGQGGLSHPLEQADGSEVSLRPSIA
jgi:hypothetical protein